MLFSRKNPDLVDAQYTKNQAWKSEKVTLFYNSMYVQYINSQYNSILMPAGHLGLPPSRSCVTGRALSIQVNIIYHCVEIIIVLVTVKGIYSIFEGLLPVFGFVISFCVGLWYYTLEKSGWSSSIMVSSRGYTTYLSNRTCQI